MGFQELTAAERLRNLELRVEAVERGFIQGDYDGHRRAHEAMMELVLERRKLRMAIQEKTISGLVWAVILGMGYAVWNYVVRLLKGEP